MSFLSSYRERENQIATAIILMHAAVLCTLGKPPRYEQFPEQLQISARFDGNLTVDPFIRHQ